MRMFSVLLAAVCMVFVGVAESVYAEGPPGKIVGYAHTRLAALGQDPAIVKAVRDGNAMGKSLNEIKAMDEKWKAEEGVADYMKALMENDCAKQLKKIVAADDAVFEIFVMDNQGANVCQTDKTGDYWQGDEAKFSESFAGGKGKVFVDAVEYDDGLKANISQVSVPVMDGGKAIGAMTIGVLVDKVK